MNDTSFFIPPARRKQKASTELSKSEKRARHHFENGVLIFDEELENKKKQEEEARLIESRVDYEFEYAENEEALEAKRTNAMIAAFWACHCYLEPVNVRHLTLYWLPQYVNYKLPEAEWFNDHITRLMTSPIRLEFTSTQGIAYVHSNLSKYTLLMHTCGSPLHKVPSEYFVHKDAVEMLECLCHFLEPRNHCFLVKNTFGLRGELELAAFQYNRILSYFYEPSFLILDSYLIYVHNLLSMARYRSLAHFLPQMKHITKPIHPDHIQWAQLHALDPKNTNYDEKRRVFEEDMLALYNALSHLEIDTVKNELTALWSKKASYVTDQIAIRLGTISEQLYGGLNK